VIALIVDARGASRRAIQLKECCEGAGWTARVVEISTQCKLLPDVDLVLAHVGEVQKDSGDDVGALLAHYGRSTWTLCYSGSTPLPEASESTLPFVAVFPQTVDPDDPDDSFMDRVWLVLNAAASGTTVPRDDFRSLVLGFDELLEAKAVLMTALMTGHAPSQNLRGILQGPYPWLEQAIASLRHGDMVELESIRQRLFE
jgi:hypothetical protein